MLSATPKKFGRVRSPRTNLAERMMRIIPFLFFSIKSCSLRPCIARKNSWGIQSAIASSSLYFLDGDGRSSSILHLQPYQKWLLYFYLILTLYQQSSKSFVVPSNSFIIRESHTIRESHSSLMSLKVPITSFQKRQVL